MCEGLSKVLMCWWCNLGPVEHVDVALFPGDPGGRGHDSPTPEIGDPEGVEAHNHLRVWNAVCVVGFRVYSKDAGLKLLIVMEGSELLEDSMGEKGPADLDNTQFNAGVCEPITRQGQLKDDVKAPYPPIIRKDGEVIPDEKPADLHSPIQKYVRMDSTDMARMNT